MIRGTRGWPGASRHAQEKHAGCGGVEGAAGQLPEARGWVGPRHRMQEMGACGSRDGGQHWVVKWGGLLTPLAALLAPGPPRGPLSTPTIRSVPHYPNSQSQGRHVAGAPEELCLHTHERCHLLTLRAAARGGTGVPVPTQASPDPLRRLPQRKRTPWQMSRRLRAKQATGTVSPLAPPVCLSALHEHRTTRRQARLGAMLASDGNHTSQY